MDWMGKYNFWCKNEYFDEKTKKELQNIQGNEKEIEDRFYKELEFGTGGLRGVLGAGSNRMNIYTVRKATQGLANYILKSDGNKKVAIAYDSRHMSPEFAEEAALCLNANGIETYRFASLRPTPELSFAVRYLKCIAGIVITASHNPSEYNGYKVYWKDGGQITPPLDREIITEVNAILDFSKVKTIDKERAISSGLYHTISDKIDTAYINAVKECGFNRDLVRKHGGDIKIVYTPLHGAGNFPVRRILKEIGFKNVFVVPEQELTDGDFPTVSYPNPEDPKAFELAIKYAKQKKADIVMATDPDADRLGIYVKNAEGEYTPLTGNMSGMIIGEYILSQRKERGLLPDNGALVSTIVTTDMAKVMAKEYNVKFIETLTGFKYIGEQIKKFEEDHSYQYMFGLEESYGCLVGTYARDKDAVAAVMMVAEAAVYYMQKGLNLCEQLEVMYKKYGYFKEELVTKTLKGLEGKKEIDSLMMKLRNDPPKFIGSFAVEKIRDYKKGKICNIKSGDCIDAGLPVSNVLYFELSNGAWCCVRPSGTEPKIKYYIGTVADNHEKAENGLKEIESAFLSQ